MLCFLNIAADKALAQQASINEAEHTISFSNEKIKAVLDYDHKVNISSLVVNNQEVIHGDSGCYSMIKTKDQFFSTLHLLQSPQVDVKSNIIHIKNIAYGEENSIKENWNIIVTKDSIQININRICAKELQVEKSAFPVFNFKSVKTWDGAYQDYGGLAWFYLFNQRLQTYGVHSSSSRFWNAETSNGLTIKANAGAKHVAMDYSRTASDKLAFCVDVSPTEFILRFDSGTNRRRFIRDTVAPVWSSFTLHKGTTGESITLSYFDFEQEYGRGKLAGINQKEVSAVLNTIARIGVIDKQHFGGNSWHTPYGPICLHEQYIAQMGIAINDPSYLKGYQDCLDFYRDHAIKKDGRVWPRWAYTNEDAMPGQFNEEGFYEAQWGYLMDSNPDYVTNVSELYDQNGNLDWVRTHQSACEKALDWILKRDSNGNGLVEMMTDSTAQKRGSDWIDIIWASFENAFVNAKLYHALVLWANIEKQLGNSQKEQVYQAFAEKLKTSFNKTTSEGGFWDEDNKCYIHWRDKDGSLHGRNMVTPVNFMAIGYDICNDEARKKTILDGIETGMQKENLFFWPLCLYSYAPGEGNDWQFPFPNYENGDIFLSWGALGVKAYASYKPDLAVKYVENVLNQYAKDGLAFQRYGRQQQDGRGDDILSGNGLTVTGLYEAVYGINPKYNRLYLSPHITSQLDGTQLKYKYQNKPLVINESLNQYAVSDGRFSIAATKDFGFSSIKDSLYFFNGDEEKFSLKAVVSSGNSLSINIKNWNVDTYEWIQSATASASSVNYHVANLSANKSYSILVDNKLLTKATSSKDGNVIFTCSASNKRQQITIVHE